MNPMFGKLKKKIRGTVVLIITLQTITLVIAVIILVFLLSTH